MTLPDPQAARRRRGDLPHAIRVATRLADNKYLIRDLEKIGRLYQRIVVPEVERLAKANGLTFVQAVDAICEERG